MSEISKEARAIIEAASGMDDPLPGDKERIFNLLAASLGQIGDSGVPPTSERTSKSPKGGVSSRNKILLFAIAAILLLGGAMSAIMLNYSVAETKSTGPASNSKPASLLPAEKKDEVELGSFYPSAQPTEIDTEEENEEKEEKAVKRHRKSDKSEASSTDASEDPPSEVSTLKEELRLLNNAQMARRSGHIARALAYLGEHEQRFPNGLLVEEREAARVFTYCKDNRLAEARAVTNSFLSRFPNSPLTGRVKSSCVFEKNGGDGDVL